MIAANNEYVIIMSLFLIWWSVIKPSCKHSNYPCTSSTEQALWPAMHYSHFTLCLKGQCTFVKIYIFYNKYVARNKIYAYDEAFASNIANIRKKKC